MAKQQKLVRGDHVYVHRRPAEIKVAYQHHGIYIGDGRVVHFSGEPTQIGEAKVEVTTLGEFLAGGTLKIRRYKTGALPLEESAKRALAKVGQRGYNFILNNCEHFACWCRTGDQRSKQVEKAVTWVGRALGWPLRSVLDAVVRSRRSP